MGYPNRKSNHRFFCDNLKKNVTVTIYYHQDENEYYKQYECGRECSHRNVCQFICPKEYFDFDI